MPTKAIDVSVYQGVINWKEVLAGGIENVIVRASIGLEADERFHENVQGALAAGLHVGAYHYSKAPNTAQALREAEFFLRQLSPYRLDLPVAFDFENTVHTPLSKTQCTEIVKAFCGRMEDAAYYVALYTSASWLNSKFDLPQLERFDKWVAHYGVDKPNYSGSYGMWQYSVVGTSGQKGVHYWTYGSVPGVSANCDVNYLYRDYPDIIKSAGLNGWGTDRPAPDNYEALYEAEQQLRIAAEADRDRYRELYYSKDEECKNQASVIAALQKKIDDARNVLR